jgi:hypothetical protein
MHPNDRPGAGDEPRRAMIPPTFLRHLADFDGPFGLSAQVEIVWSTPRRMQGLIAAGRMPRDGWLVLPIGPFQVAIRLVAPEAERALDAARRSLAPSVN